MSVDLVAAGTVRGAGPVSPVAGIGLEGYAGIVTVLAGGHVRLMVYVPLGMVGTDRVCEIRPLGRHRFE